MKRTDLLDRFVLNAICDDYEDLETIYAVVARDALDCGMRVEPSEVLGALEAVVKSCLAKAYRLTVEPPEELTGMPSSEELERPHTIYFYLTPEGMEVHLAVPDDWPFDEQGNVREHWSPPRD